MVWDEEEKRKFFYVDKDELVEFGGFTDIDSAGNVVALMVPNYQVDGKTGTWLPYDSEVVEGVCFFMMRNTWSRFFHYWVSGSSPSMTTMTAAIIMVQPWGWIWLSATW